MTYNEVEIAKRRRRRIQKRLLKGVLFTLLLAVALAPIVDYLANFPRERHARRYSYVERVWNGLSAATRVAYLKLSAPDPNLKASPLEVVEVYIRGERLDELNKDLPSSGRDFQRAKVKLEDKEFSAEVRYRGDSVNHWAYPNKSWRVQLRKGKDLKGLRTFNLNVPRSPSQLSNFLGYKMGSQVRGLLVPEAKNVQFRLNRMFDGVRLMLEQVDQDFLLRRNLSPGKIFIGDINTAQIYGGEKREHLYLTPEAWDVRNFEEVYNQKEFHRLISLIKNEHNPYEFARELERLVDVDELLKYMALLELVGSVHVDETHNGKFYFDPVRGKLRPIVWDTVAYFWKNRFGLDLAVNNLFRVVLMNPELRERKDALLWKWTSGRFSTESIQRMIREEVERIAPDLRSFALKITANDKGVRHLSNREWQKNLTELYESVAARNEMIRSELSKAEIAYSWQPSEESARAGILAIESRGRAAAVFESLAVEGVSPESIEIQRLGLEDIGRQLREEFRPQRGSASNAAVAMGDILYSKRRAQKGAAEIVKSRYLFEVRSKAPISPEQLKLSFRNNISSEPLEAVYDQSIPAKLSHAKNSVWWRPEDYIEENIRRIGPGEVKITETLVVGKGERLEVQPGTTLMLASGVSIIADGGNLSFAGEEGKGIEVKAIDPSAGPWGVIAQIGGAGLGIAHTSISGASQAQHRGVRLEGALSVNNSNAQINSLVLKDHFADFRSARVTAVNSKVNNSLPFAYRSLHSFVDDKGFEHNYSEPKLAASSAEGLAVGTDSRVEREFKYSIQTAGSAPSDVPLDDLAEALREKLKSAVNQRELWSAPKLTGTSFYLDDSVGDFLFRDIYFDTSDDLAYKNQISYRLRNRFSSNSAYKTHLKKTSLTDYWPYRLEFQAKTNRRELGGGYSLVDETRLEFRKESQPFSEDFLPPPAPWTLREFVPYFRSGVFRGMLGKPAQEVVRFLKSRGEDREEFNFLPNLVVVTERHRKHLNIPSEFGSGPNPEQAYILTLDRSEILDGPSYLRFVRSREMGLTDVKSPPLLGAILEMEIEFERNVSDQLDREIKEDSDPARTEKLKAVRQAFLDDQELIRKLITEAYGELGYSFAPASKSKYVQAVEIAEASPVRRLRKPNYKPL